MHIHAELAGDYGGAIFLAHPNDDVDILNSILWNNSAPSGPEIGHFVCCPPNALDVTFSNIEGGWAGAGNKNVDPNFVNPSQGNYRLNCPSGSLGCIDAGSVAAVALDDLDVDENPNTTGPAPDLDFLPRVVGGSPAKPDMGCYERQLPPSCEGADVNGDGCVNVLDLLAVINGWGACGSPCPADVSPLSDNACGAGAGDGTVNVTDLLAVINGWGPCPSCSEPTSPPEDALDCMEICANASDFGGCMQKCMCALGYDTCE